MEQFIRRKRGQSDMLVKRFGIYFLLITGIITGIYYLNGSVTDITAKEEIEEIEEITGALRFKTEYEALNGELNEDGTSKYTHLLISEDNNIMYLEYADLMDFVSSGTGLLYFGRPACPWCRLLVPPLLEFADENSAPVYYYDIEQDREENNEKYINILSVFQAYLPTNRVVLPQLFYMQNGSVQADLLMFQHEYLSDNEHEKVKQVLSDMRNPTAVTPDSNIDYDDCACD